MYLGLAVLQSSAMPPVWIAPEIVIKRHVQVPRVLRNSPEAKLNALNLDICLVDTVWSGGKVYFVRSNVQTSLNAEC